MQKIHYIFGQLRDDDVRWLGEVGVRVPFRANDVLVEVGHDSEKLLFVLAGKLAIVVNGTTIAHLGVGEVAGEMSFVDSHPPSATVVALTNGRTLAIDKHRLLTRAEQDPEFGMRFYRALSIFMADRLRHTTARIGYGHTEPQDDDVMIVGEGDEDIHDAATRAGQRFERMLAELRGDND
jgi:CRP-like cAMP-binding protein